MCCWVVTAAPLSGLDTPSDDVIFCDNDVMCVDDAMCDCSRCEGPQDPRSPSRAEGCHWLPERSASSSCREAHSQGSTPVRLQGRKRKDSRGTAAGQQQADNRRTGGGQQEGSQFSTALVVAGIMQVMSALSAHPRAFVKEGACMLGILKVSCFGSQDHLHAAERLLWCGACSGVFGKPLSSVTVGWAVWVRVSWAWLCQPTGKYTCVAFWCVSAAVCPLTCCY